MGFSFRKLGVFIAAVVVLLLGLALVSFSYTNAGVADIAGSGGVQLMAPDLSAVPESVTEDAAALATELFGGYREKYDDFLSQLLATYVEAEDKDFVVIFNSGGWGWNFLENSPGWHSIFGGIEAELDNLGYTSLLLDYRRTEASWRAIIDEFVEVVRVYPSKTKYLARRVEFLTSHVPDLKVIIAGESNGTVISDSTMHLLRDNPQVYSIQTGPPFWHKNLMWDRTLVLTHNGITPDSFSRGDVRTVLWASIKVLFNLTPPEEEEPGRLFLFLRAPGHDYRWQYPDVYSQITKFLEENFGFKQE